MEVAATATAVMTAEVHRTGVGAVRTVAQNLLTS